MADPFDATIRPLVPKNFGLGMLGSVLDFLLKKIVIR